MPLYSIGISAKTHTVEEREKFALLDQQLIHRNHELIETGLVEEIVSLSTCNRIEHYFITEKTLEPVIDKLFGSPAPKNLNIRKNSSASHHLFAVSAGLNSQILGENEVLGQIKKAYLLSQENDLTAKHLNVLFQKAIYVGKRIRTVTDISKCSVSTGGIILDKIKKRYDDLSQISVLMIGTGNISRSVTMSLHHKGVKNIFLSNRNPKVGELIAKEMEATYIPINKLYDSIKTSDVVISSTTAPHYLITKDHEAYFNHGKKLMIDLAVPRDIHPEVGDYENIDLINIDAITPLSALNQSKREQAVLKAEYIIAMENCNYCYNRLLSDKSSPPATISFYDFKKLYKHHKAHS